MNTFAPKSGHASRGGFTLVEMLVAITILAAIMLMATQMIGTTSKVWKTTTAKIEAFQGARDGFQLMTDELRQATLNTYWDYYDAGGHTQSNYTTTTFSPVDYGRQSELHFRTGVTLYTANNAAVPPQVASTQGVFFQAPLGYTATPSLYGNLQNLLNSTGFFLQCTDGTAWSTPPRPFLPR